ncbi:hypothetical protein CDAR_413471 [Caerostris darwini]|uniref:Uncharacterized protein n=1 Tax=Caerostris darwini TaxID=1538125 RepID=A0AAV4S4X1_9ARAC|nr:hypothetical protein CDAR_413471 [Caerostris darwini]
MTSWLDMHGFCGRSYTNCRDIGDREYRQGALVSDVKKRNALPEHSALGGRTLQSKEDSSEQRGFDQGH